MKKYSPYFTALGIFLFVSSMSLYAFEEQGDYLFGFHCFAFGALSVFSSIQVFICWLANPLTLIGLFMLYKKPALALYPLGLALLLAFSFLFIDAIPGVPLYNDVKASKGIITGIGTGYWIWVSGVFTLLVSSIFSFIYSGKN